MTLRASALLATSLALLASAAPVRAADPLADLPLRIGTAYLFNERENDGFQRDRGTWRIEHGSLGAGQLSLRISIEPQPHGLPVESGPAVLFAGMQVFGGMGDMGAGEPIDALGTTVLPGCDDRACRYDGIIDLPTADVRAAVQRLGQRANVAWLEVGLTLVRTFGDGQWLQVIPLFTDELDDRSGDAGTLGAIHATTGEVFPYGLFPATEATAIGPRGAWMFTTAFNYARAVERLRKEAEDASQPLTMAGVHLRAELDPNCETAGHITMHDDAGSRVFHVDMWERSSVEEDVEVPVGVPWRLTLHNSGGFDIGFQGWGVKLGHIESAGGNLDVRATFDCENQTGTIDVVGGVAAPDPTQQVVIPPQTPEPPRVIPSEPPAGLESAAPSSGPRAVGAPSAPAQSSEALDAGVIRAVAIAGLISLVGALLLSGGSRRPR